MNAGGDLSVNNELARRVPPGAGAGQGSIPGHRCRGPYLFKGPHCRIRRARAAGR